MESLNNSISDEEWLQRRSEAITYLTQKKKKVFIYSTICVVMDAFCVIACFVIGKISILSVLLGIAGVLSFVIGINLLISKIPSINNEIKQAKGYLKDLKKIEYKIRLEKNQKQNNSILFGVGGVCVTILGIITIIYVISGMSEENVLSKAEQLFSKRNYEEALETYLSIEEESQYYKEAISSIYKKGILLFENDEYAECKLYMESLDKYEKSVGYSYLSGVLDSYNKKKDLDYCAITGILNSYSEDGFQPATEALQKEPFVNYLPLLENAGLYRSDETFLKDMMVMKYDLYCYINLGTSITSASWMKDVEGVTTERVSDNANNNRYDCKCVFISDGVYQCNVEYIDWVTGDEEGYSFNMHFDNDKLIVEMLSSTETEDKVSFVGGTYSRFEESEEPVEWKSITINYP